MNIDFYQVMAHVLKAETKHADFPDIIIRVRSGESLKDMLDAIRDVNDGGIMTTAFTLVMEEMLEAQEARENGWKKDVIDELYDAVAVILRAIEKMEEKSK